MPQSKPGQPYGRTRAEFIKQITSKKHYASQILSYKIFSFCEHLRGLNTKFSIQVAGLSNKRRRGGAAAAVRYGCPGLARDHESLEFLSPKLLGYPRWKWVHMTRLEKRSTQQEENFKKIVNISHNRRFCGFIFKFVWAVYGGDLIGFCQSFRKVILKNDQRQTKSKKSQNVHGYEPLWYAHSTALPQSYPASIGSGRSNLLEMWTIWDGRMLNYYMGWQADPKMYCSIYT